MPKRIRPPSVVIDSITAKAVEVRSAATALSARISKFEDYLDKLPGKVEADAAGEHPDDDDSGNLSLLLRLHRVGSSWRLSWATWHPSMDDDPSRGPDYSLLSDAPVRIKIAAIDIFPALFEEIRESQDRLTDDLLKASAKFDEFEKTLPQITNRQIPRLSANSISTSIAATLGKLAAQTSVKREVQNGSKQ